MLLDGNVLVGRLATHAEFYVPLDGTGFVRFATLDGSRFDAIDAALSITSGSSRSLSFPPRTRFGGLGTCPRFAYPVARSLSPLDGRRTAPSQSLGIPRNAFAGGLSLFNGLCPTSRGGLV